MTANQSAVSRLLASFEDEREIEVLPIEEVQADLRIHGIDPTASIAFAERLAARVQSGAVPGHATHSDMCPDAERLTGPAWVSKDDARITRVGRFLRRSRLDELPQLVNVLRGDMSLVRGSRPLLQAQLQGHVRGDIPKRALDYALATLLLVLATPLLLLLALLIRLDSPGPVFFVQERLGQHRRPFGCIKFRTTVNLDCRIAPSNPEARLSSHQWSEKPGAGQPNWLPPERVPAASVALFHDIRRFLRLSRRHPFTRSNADDRQPYGSPK
jgi:lipopolysaccharide/colanic/teichoic acid biosynthesis glycosyltransferase